MKNVFIKKGNESKQKEVDGKIFRLLQKSNNMEAIIAELDVGVESDRYFHEGEEFHLVLSGEIEYIVGDEVYRMEAGDSLWHVSDISHGAKNVGDEKAVYITISTPPTFM